MKYINNFVIIINIFLKLVKMKENNLILKDDINFLEYPNWLISDRNNEKEIVVNKTDGYYRIATTADKLPNRFDKVVLYSLLTELNKNNFEFLEYVTTRHAIAKSIYDNGRRISATDYKRVFKALERWSNITIKFKGTFYNGDDKTTRLFSIIDDVIFNHETKKLYIRFNQQYVEHLKATNFYKYINFEEYKRLKKPISNRLYEILIKTFKARDKWHIDILKLAEKLTFSSKYPSKILEKLKPAINEINDNTELQIKFEYKKESKLCIFRAISKIEQEKTNLGKSLNQEKHNDLELETTLEMLPKKISGMKSIKELLGEFINNKGVDYVKTNINYSLKNSSDNLKGYLQKSLKENWGKDFVQQKNKEKTEPQKKNRYQILKELKDEFDEMIHQKKAKYVNKLPKIEREKLIREFVTSKQMLFFKQKYDEVGFKDPMIKNLFISFVNIENEDDLNYDENFKNYCKEHDLIVEKKGNDFYIIENEQLKFGI